VRDTLFVFKKQTGNLPIFAGAADGIL